MQIFEVFRGINFLKIDASAILDAFSISFSNIISVQEITPQCFINQYSEVEKDFPFISLGLQFLVFFSILILFLLI
jgi:hypothetical protein